MLGPLLFTHLRGGEFILLEVATAPAFLLFSLFIKVEAQFNYIYLRNTCGASAFDFFDPKIALRTATKIPFMYSFSENCAA
jgi:hypothetical protein